MGRARLLKMPARKMLGGFGCLTLAICIALTGSLPAHADNQTFADLLALAKAQAASGHRWAPAGDNMTETVMSMMDLVSTATPDELAELASLLEAGITRPGAVRARTPESAATARLSDAASAPAPPAAAGPQVFATALPRQPAVVSTHPEAEGARQDGSNQTEPSRVASIPDRHGPMGPGELGPGPPLPSRIEPSQLGLSQLGLSQLGPSRIGPSQIVPDQAGVATSGSRAAVLFARRRDG